MKYLRLKNWEKYQHYTDRSPPWIKLYNSLLDDYEFALLSDEVKWHVVASTLLASRTNNQIPCDAAWITRKISASTPVDISLLLSSGMFEEFQADKNASAVVEQDASKTLAQRERKRQRDNPPKVPHEDMFVKFWEDYPRQRRGDKDKARAAWTKRMKEGVDPADILAGLERYATGKEVADGYAKQAVAWLNASRWTDQPPPATAKDDRSLYQRTFGVN